tara:strand:- start:3172 stop:4080 length:909 start_codon:yes stop_codon:yes gene_type:complete
MIKLYRVNKDYDSMRIDRWIKKNINNLPQSLIEKLLRIGKIKLNGKKIKSSQKVFTNDLIKIYKFEFKNVIEKKILIPNKKILKKNESSIIFNNEDIIAINKHAGIAVQGGTKSRLNLTDIFTKSKYFDDIKPFTVHRLDKDTSGVLIFGKNRKAAQTLTSLFRLRKIYKTYICVCSGEINSNKGEWIHNLEKFENNKKVIEKAITYYRVLDRNQNYSLVELKPITGRKHQLRKQLSFLGHPIIGDNKYSTSNNISKYLMLHSYTLKFKINNNKFSFKAPLPKHFLEFLVKKKFILPNFLKN